MTRTVLITGVAGGIGRAAAQLFAANGWRVAGVDRSADAQVESVHKYVVGDVADPASVAAIVDALRDDPGRLDALINNAAIQICKPIQEMEVEEWDQTMAVNVRSTFLLVKATYSWLRRSAGSIVNVSSVHAVSTSQHVAAYAASKGALAALTRALAVEFGSQGIRVNSVLPGAVDTPMLRAGLARAASPSYTADAMREVASRTVLGRIGEPREAAEAILFLADRDRSSFVTGQVLIVDGGATARLSTEAFLQAPSHAHPVHLDRVHSVPPR